MKKLSVDMRTPADKLWDNALTISLLLFFTFSSYLMTGCSSAEKVSTLKEAVSNQDNNLSSGVYQNHKGQNVYVESKNLDKKIAELEKDNKELSLANWHHQTEIESLKKEKAKLLLELSLMKMKRDAMTARQPASAGDK
jgi:predicted RNase H-like nuclease (RuvC/YqgF family)